MAGSVFCNNCGEPMKGEPPIADDPAQPQPCLKCGSTSRRINHSGATGIYSMPGSTANVSEMLLVKAQELITNGEFGIATVVAYTACEISAERAISQAFAAKGIAYLEDWPIRFPSSRPHNAVLGDKIQGQSFWPDFKESAKRRHGFVHKGKTITKAEASFKAASDLVAYLK